MSQPGIHTSLEPFTQFLGLYVHGDIGDITLYTDRHGKTVAFPKSPPTKPPSPAQANQRARFRQAQKNYMSVSEATKRDWELAMQRMSLDLTGQNAFISTSLRPDDTALQFIARRTGIELTPPPPV